MKKYSIPILSGLIGSVITLIFFIAFYSSEKSSPEFEKIADFPSAKVIYTTNSEGEQVSLDFTEISKELMDGVVHIRSIQKVEQREMPAYPQLPDFFRDFFGDEFYQQYRRQQQDQQGDTPQYRRMGSGSGVIIDKEGYIVTNNHVIANADEVEVALHDNRTFTAKIIGTDPTTDLALLQIRGDNLTPIPVIDSDNIEVGEWVLAIGNPFNLNSTVTAGIISAKSRSLNILRDQYAIESFIQTDAAINPGNSGGALVNLQGGLIGINTAIASPTGAYAGYGFAIPSNIVNKVINDLLEYGTVQRGYLGVRIIDVTGNFAKEKGLDVTEGVYIDSVETESSAEKAGIREGDVITEINGKEVTKASELQEMVARHRPGDKVDLVIRRDGRTINRTATLQSIEGAVKMTSRERGEILSVLGAEMVTVTREEAKELGIDGGVKITRLYPGKLRKQTEIKTGFIITHVNSKKITTLEELEDIIKDIEGGVMLEGIYEDMPGVYYYAFGL